MNAKNLMPGDWVMLFGQVTEVWMVDVSHEDEEDQLINYLEACDFEPILLTPKILEKNGFYDGSGGSKLNYVIQTNEYQISYYPKTNRFSIYKKGIDPFYDKDQFFCGFKNIVKYIHELQHALKLCGIKKEIIL